VVVRPAVSCGAANRRKARFQSDLWAVFAIEQKKPGEEKNVKMLRTLLTTLRGLILGRREVAAPAAPSLQLAVVQQPMHQHRAVLAKESEGRSSMNVAYEKLIQHLDEHEIKYLTSADHRSICADFRGEVGLYRIVATVDSEDGLFQVFGHSPVRVPEGSRPAIAETIARANFGLKIGKFEFDFDDGDLRFQVSQILIDDVLEDETIRRLIGTTMAMLNAYLPAVLSVIYANELPKDAVKHIEGRQTPPSDSDEE
jgi:hypothetical protein